MADSYLPSNWGTLHFQAPRKHQASVACWWEMTGTTRGEDRRGQTGGDVVWRQCSTLPLGTTVCNYGGGEGRGSIHPEKQLNAIKRAERIKGFMYHKWLKEMSMFGAGSSEYRPWCSVLSCLCTGTVLEGGTLLTAHVTAVPFSRWRPRPIGPFLVSFSTPSKTTSM